MNEAPPAGIHELSPDLIERGIEEGWLPAFARLREQSDRYETQLATVSRAWVQWVTLHTGATLSDHGAVRLGMVRRPPGFVWETLSAAGHRV